MKSVAFVLFILFLSVRSHAQSSCHEAILNLADQQILYGQVTELLPSGLSYVQVFGEEHTRSFMFGNVVENYHGGPYSSSGFFRGRLTQVEILDGKITQVRPTTTNEIYENSKIDFHLTPAGEGVLGQFFRGELRFVDLRLHAGSPASSVVLAKIFQAYQVGLNVPLPLPDSNSLGVRIFEVHRLALLTYLLVPKVQENLETISILIP